MILEAALLFVPVSPLPAAPTAPTLIEESAEPKIDDNRWYTGSLDRAIATAERNEQMVLLYFWVPGSDQCTAMYEDTIKADAPTDEMRSFILVSVDSSQADKYPLFERFSITTVPAIRVLAAGGEPIDGLNGYVDPERYTGELRRIQSGEATLHDLKRLVEESPDDLDLRNSLAGKYQDLGDQEMHDRVQDSIKADDPEGESVIAAQLILGDVLTACREGATGPDELDFDRLAEHIGTMQPNDAVFSAWLNLAAYHLACGDFKGRVETLANAWAVAPDVNVLNWGDQTARWLWLNRDALSKKDKAHALAMAVKATSRAELLAGDEGDGYGNRYSGENFDGFLAGRLNTLARCQHMNGLTEEAAATIGRAVELASEVEEYALRHAAYAAGDPDESFHPHNDTAPVWSPDGKKLLFVTDRHSEEGIYNDELYSVTVSSGKEKRLTRTSSNENGACWGPRGKTIAFTSDRFLTNGIYTAKADGSRQTLLARFDPETPTGTGAPCYSPNGKHIAFESLVNGKSEIAVMDAKGKHEPTILTADTPETDMTPVWSSDGKRILYMSNRAGDADIYSIAADGSDDRNITNAPKESWDMDGELSPKGDRMVFSSWRSGTLEIYTCNPEGGNVQCLTNSAETEDRHPRWSPNGKKIAFDRKLKDGGTLICVMNADGSKPAPVVRVRE